MSSAPSNTDLRAIINHRRSPCATFTCNHTNDWTQEPRKACAYVCLFDDAQNLNDLDHLELLMRAAYRANNMQLTTELLAQNVALLDARYLAFRCGALDSDCALYRRYRANRCIFDDQDADESDVGRKIEPAVLSRMVDRMSAHLSRFEEGEFHAAHHPLMPMMLYDIHAAIKQLDGQRLTADEFKREVWGAFGEITWPKLLRLQKRRSVVLPTGFDLWLADLINGVCRLWAGERLVSVDGNAV